MTNSPVIQNPVDRALTAAYLDDLAAMMCRHIGKMGEEQEMLMLARLDAINAIRLRLCGDEPTRS